MKLKSINISEVFKKKFTWIKIFIMIAAYGYLIYTFINFEHYEDFSYYFKTHGLENLKYLLCCLILIPLNWFLESLKWKQVLSKIQVLSLGQAIKSVLIGLTSGFFTPNRVGEPVGRSMFLADGNKIKGVICSLICTLSQSFATLFFVCIAIVLACNIVVELEQIPQIILVRNIGIIAAVTVFLLYLTIPFWVGKLKLKSEKLQDIARAISLISYASLLKVSLYSIVRFAVYSFQYFLMLKFFAVDIHFSTAMVLIPINYFLVSIIPSVAFAELGIRGSSALLVMEPLLGNTLGVALAAMSLWFINYVIPMLVGSLLLIKTERK